jgi:hypothetical protein
MGEDKICECEKKHKGHVCMLKCKGKIHEIKKLSRTPNVACLTCGEQANSEVHVCLPVPLFV